MHRLKFIITILLVVPGAVAPASAQQGGGSELYLREYADPRALGAALVKEGNWVEAKEVLERAELEYPNDPRVLKMLAQTYVAIGRERAASGDDVEAIYFFERALTKDDQLGDAWLALGEA
ncbi:MAG: tetratricopeptide repeat protein, partial [Candidatus Dadabacteria bacterium]